MHSPHSLPSLPLRLWSYAKVIVIVIVCFILASCGQQKNISPIGDNTSFPGKLLTLSDSEFLLLNTNAANTFSDGSIQRYQIDKDLNPILQNTFVIDTHGTDIALSADHKLLALSFDGSKQDTKIVLYNFSNADDPQLIPALTLNFASTGSKQSIKQLNFFKVDGFEGYYLYGVILTSRLDTGAGAYIPERTFVARIAPDLSASKVLFVLGYGIGDEKLGAQTLATKSDSLKQDFRSEDIQYMFGSTAPAYDSKHKLFIAFPTGSMNGFNNVDSDDTVDFDVNARNRFPQLPDPLQYFSGRSNPNSPCPEIDLKCIKSDLRAVSLFAVDMENFLKNIDNTPLDLSVYFVPLAWNENGIPFGYKTNNSIINVDSNSSDDIKSFTFQTGFWTSYSLDSDSLLVGKNDPTYDGDTGNGNDMLKISGLEILAENINKIKNSNEFNDTTIDPKNFSTMVNRQIIDPYHLLNNPKENTENKKSSQNLLSSDWLVNETTDIKSPGPLSPYIYSRTVKSNGKNAFLAAPTAVFNFDVVCGISEDDQTCFPYWVRATYLGLGNQGRDASWLTINVPTPLEDKTIYNDATSDPTVFTTYSFKDFGAQVCTTIMEKNIYCANFLTAEFTRIQLVQSDNKYQFIKL